MSPEEAKSKDAATQALWRIAETDDTRQVESILASGAQIDAGNAYGTTALMRAASQGRTRMVRVLLEHGADPNRSRNDKFTPLLLAAFFGHEEVVKILAEHGAHIDAATRFGTSAQMWAASRTFKDVVHYLDNPQSSPSCSKVDRVKETRPIDGKQRATVAVIANDKPTMRTASMASEAAAERARRLLAPGLSAPDNPIVQSVREESQSQEVLQPLTPKPWLFSRLQALPESSGVYALTTLLLVVAIFGFILQRKERLREIAPQTLPNAVIDASSLSVRPGTPDSFPSGGEVPKMTPADSKVDKLVLDNKVNQTYYKPQPEQPVATRNVALPTADRSRGDISEKQVGVTNVVEQQTNPTPAAEEARRTELPAVPTPSAQPQPVVSSAPSVKRPPPLTTELITGSKSSSPKGKVILWP